MVAGLPGEGQLQKVMALFRTHDDKRMVQLDVLRGVAVLLVVPDSFLHERGQLSILRWLPETLTGSARSRILIENWSRLVRE